MRRTTRFKLLVARGFVLFCVMCFCMMQVGCNNMWIGIGKDMGVVGENISRHNVEKENLRKNGTNNRGAFTLFEEWFGK